MTVDNTGATAIRGIDLSIMYATHEAFRRDLAALVAAADRGNGPAPEVRAGWALFKAHLMVHHGAEDAALWPALRRTIAGLPHRTALLDAMESEHAQLDPLLAGVEECLPDSDPARLRTASRRLSEALCAHLDHEEVDALPLVVAALPASDWAAFGQESRHRLGIRGAAHYFPWLLDGASADRRAQVCGLLPAPLRLVLRSIWIPRYRRTPRWIARQ